MAQIQFPRSETRAASGPNYARRIVLCRARIRTRQTHRAPDCSHYFIIIVRHFAAAAATAATLIHLAPVVVVAVEHCAVGARQSRLMVGAVDVERDIYSNHRRRRRESDALRYMMMIIIIMMRSEAKK